MDGMTTNLQNTQTMGKTVAGKTLTPAETAAKEKKLKKVCADFESMLVYQLLKSMRQTVPKSGFLSGSHGKDTYEMMLDQKVADAMAAKGDGLGIQKILYNQLKARYIK
jgi:flagellar protein FlgJ